MSIFNVVLLTFSAFIAATGQLLLKVGADKKVQLVDFLNLYVLIGLVLYGLATMIWIYALSVEKLVNVYIFTALTFALVYLGGVFLLGEVLNLASITGVFLVLIGLYLIITHGSPA